MADNETKVVITGDATGASSAMKEAADATQQGTQKIESSLGGIGKIFQQVVGGFAGVGHAAPEHMNKAAEAVEGLGGKLKGSVSGIKSSLGALGEGFEAVTKLWGTLAAVVAGGAFFKEAISETNKLTGEVMGLSKRLGMTVEEANTLNSALGIIGTDSETYIDTFQRFAMQLRRNEEGIQKLGVETRDTNGHLRDSNEMFTEALKVVSAYKPGIDQTEAAMQLFGKSVDDVMKLQKLNNGVLEEAREKNEALGLVVTQQNVEGAKKYKLAMHDVKEVMEAIMKTVGEAVMPIFTELANYLASTGPYVVNVFRGALTALLLVFRGVQVAVKVLVAVVAEAFNGIIDQATNFSDVMTALFRGDFAGALDAAKRIKDRFVQGFVNIKDAAKDAAKEASDAFSDDMGNLWGPKTPAKVSMGKGTRTMGELGKQKQDKSQMPQFEEELAETKVKFEKENDMRELDKAAEEAFWRDKLKTVSMSSADQLSVRKKLAEAELAVMKEKKQQSDQLAMEEIDAVQKAGLAQIDYSKQEMEAQLANGKITVQESIKLEQRMEDERNRITKEGVEARIALLSKDPTKNVVALRRLNDELDAEEQQHALKTRALEIKNNQEMAKDYQQVFGQIAQSWANTVSALIQHQMTWAQAMRSFFSSALSSIASFIAQIIEKKLAAFAVEKALSLAGIGNNAAEAGSGAAKSVASIPYVGPILAIAAMAAIFAATMGMQSHVKSARGGYDIPSGVNPMTQLHEEEMVLPKEQANAVRDMAESGSRGGGLTINAIPMPGGFFMAHQDEFIKVMKHAQRNGRI